MDEGLIKKFIPFALGNIITLILSVVTVPIVTRILSPEQYGKAAMFTLATSIICTIILMGCEQSFVRFFYEEKVRSRTKLLYECIKIPIVVSCIASIGIVILRRNISMVLFNEYSLKSIIFVIVQSIFMALNTFALLVIRMQQKGKTYSILLVINKITNFILIIFLVNILTNDYKIIIIAAVVSNLFVTICAIVFEFKFWNFKDSKNMELKNTTSNIVKFAIPLVFTFMINWFFQSIDKMSIKHWVNYEELGMYTSAFTLVGLLNVVQSAFTTFWTPVAFERYEKDSKDIKFFEKINKIISYIMLLVAILLILFKDIIILILGSKYKSAAFVMPFLVFMPVMYTISETTQIGINFSKKSNCHIVVAVVSLIVDIIGMYLLVPILGARGAAISTGIAYISFFTMRTFLSLKFYKVNYNLKKFYTITALIVVYAFYATFNSINLIYILIGIVELVMLSMFYKDVVKELFSMILVLRKKRIKKI
ncbi:oligosaccharide flippase family protein [Clostridium estertheticum]|uniref:lipopolysaccharide biosynthesis protein n=1 Tax=Clostridium estertheticum TaxID=238834 RepID=UPI001C0E4524|nr:oligosaccharide flippase family protein [Clostridium estertheticum]MBU3178172.1 oligosaccharide flippase family protein [Clostridium estertheticum]